ncbi:acyl-CoA dehydratase activase [Absicoccus intestinalis]|uniref:Acyl-CoA dehydratase activase n=1 Tax=Absicoccus intestinalis TaxID=2926319 RepID=A0ABU4WKA8_9FIRM|nr:acyl-CoA dehydratase activase [Absicoccus sp. CLA-KB-P134]MDX8416992.1 acyl-CoA dehydratase activase [Absicoccus sp. CLA-KB-P134]
MMYYTCKYTPLEILAGFDVETCRLDPHPDTVDCANGCAHPNLCGFGKALIETIHTQNVREVILTDCCDVMRRIYDVLLTFEDLDFLYFLPLPHKGGPLEVNLYEARIKDFIQTYEAYSHKTFDVNKAIQAYLHQPDLPDKTDPYIRLTGAHGGHLLLEKIKDTFPNVNVMDDTCSGNRYVEKEEVDADHFIHVYANHVLNQRKPCMRMLHTENRNKDEHPIGTIYHTMKFCDYYGFEYMNMKEDVNMPLLKIETDATPQSSGQLKTRLDAFAETLGVKKQQSRKVHTDQPIYIAGIDSGSTSTDAIIMDENAKIIGRSIVATGIGATQSADKALQIALEDAHLSKDQLTNVVTTGYGRENIGNHADSVTEITCHAKGAHYLHPETKTIIDIGGQDSKVIRIDAQGIVENFVMNDKCAAGTGRFLDAQARALNMSLAELSETGLHWKNDITISSMCTVFAESEVISLVADNVAISDIIHGLNKSVASKTASLVHRIKGEPEFIMTGGVAQNAGVVQCLEQALDAKIYIDDRAQLCGAIGAALIGLEEIR